MWIHEDGCSGSGDLNTIVKSRVNAALIKAERRGTGTEEEYRDGDCCLMGFLSITIRL